MCSLCLLMDMTTIVTACQGFNVKMWDIASSTCTTELQGHIGWVFAVYIFSDGNTVVSGSFEQTVKFWDEASAACTAIMQGHTRVVQCVCISPDKAFVVSGSEDCTLRVWNSTTSVCAAILRSGGEAPVLVLFTVFACPPMTQCSSPAAQGKTYYLFTDIVA